MLAISPLFVGALLVLAILGIAGIAGFIVWIFAFLAFFRIFPSQSRKVTRLLAGVYFALFGSILALVSYQASYLVGLFVALLTTVLFAAGLIQAKPGVIENVRGEEFT